jgi:hypothetical protein
MHANETAPEAVARLSGCRCSINAREMRSTPIDAETLAAAESQSAA